jgi:hypothetical protein
MVMTLEEVGKLLAMIAAFDGRTSGKAEIHAWNEINTRGRWTYDEAREQVAQYFERDQPGWLMPGKLNDLIRSHRRDEMDRRQALPRGGAASDGSYGVVGDDPAWGRNNSPELESIHTECIKFACGYCKQPIGDRCMNLVTKNGTKIPHLDRLKVAGISDDFPPRP